VFQHPVLDAGVQTPGGTIDAGEEPSDGAVREATEETGLTSFQAPRLFAVDRVAGRDEAVMGHHVQIATQDPTPDRWDHTVTAGEADAGMQFHLYGVSFAEARRIVLPLMITQLDTLEQEMWPSR
jgi:ADP-ribose pyrophosphatase YjhB (NUDIX family)